MLVSEEEEQVIWACNEWVTRQGLPEGELLYELTDELTGEVLAILDALGTPLPPARSLRQM